jgi:putative transposase
LTQIGNPKTLTVKKEADGWYVILSCEVEKPEPLPETGKVVGIDLGLHHLVATSDGEFLGDIESLKRDARKLKTAQRAVCRKAKGSNRRKVAVQFLARRSQDLQRRRKAQLDRITRKLINKYDVIIIEALKVVQLINLGGNDAQGRGLRRNWRQAAIGILIHMLVYKAAEAGRLVIKVDPRGTSQECSVCGAIVPKGLSTRVHRCTCCGHVQDRDVNAAVNVLARGLRLLRGGSKDSKKREDGFELNA